MTHQQRASYECSTKSNVLLIPLLSARESVAVEVFAMICLELGEGRQASQFKNKTTLVTGSPSYGQE